MHQKPNYVLKAQVIASGILPVIKELDYKFRTGISYEDYEKLDEVTLIHGGIFVDEARKINHAYNKRTQRLKERIRSYLEKGQCIWLTLTFSEEVLNSTTLETRRKYVQRQLKQVSNYYVANIDFGKNTEREHFHALVVGVLHRSDFQDWIDNYGYIWIENVYQTKSEVKLSKYISKLTNHAIKETTKRQCYIYSRSKL